MKIKFQNNGNDFDGLFMYLFTHYPETYIQQVVDASASSTYPGRPGPITAVNPTLEKIPYTKNWVSENVENSNFTISFIHCYFKIDSYTLQSRQGWDNNTPLEWVLEGTNDMIHWHTIHHKVRGNELSGNGLYDNWQCSQNRFFSSFRITMIGENKWKQSNEKYIFGLSSIELFGLISNQYCTIFKKSCFPQLRFSLFAICFLDQIS